MTPQRDLTDKDLLELECAGRLSLLTKSSVDRILILRKVLYKEIFKADSRGLLDMERESRPTPLLGLIHEVTNVLEATGLMLTEHRVEDRDRSEAVLAECQRRSKAGRKPDVQTAFLALYLLCRREHHEISASWSHKSLLTLVSDSLGAIARWYLKIAEEDAKNALDGDKPGSPKMEIDSDYWMAGTEDLLGDYAPWTFGAGPLFHTLEGWDSTWQLAPDPGNTDSWGFHAYWAPLPQLVLGRLNWQDPALGVARWINRGMPTPSPELKLLRSHWGPRALMYFSQGDWFPHAGNTSEGPKFVENYRLYGLFKNSYVEKEFVRCQGLHMVDHLSWQLFANQKSDRDAAEVYRSSGKSLRHVILSLPRFGGWYGELVEIGEQILRDPSHETTEVQVLAPPIGVLGTFRHSPVTQRWYTGPHEIHLWGWQGSN